jgi:uncharacterized pyridoxamine 5'-phosphate oxidase family protein
MSNNHTLVRISLRNLEKLRNDVKKEYLRHHPEMQNIYLSDDKMFYELIEFYLRMP